MTKSKSTEEGIKSFEQLGLDGGGLVKTVEIVPEKIDFSKENEALENIDLLLRKRRSLSREERKTIDNLRIIIETVKLEKREGQLQKPIASDDRLSWEQFQSKHGESWDILNAPEEVPGKVEGLPGLEVEKVSFTRLEKALKEIRSELSNSPEMSTNSKRYIDLLKAEVAFSGILSFFKKKSIKEPSPESIALWKEFEEGKGVIFEALDFKREPKQESKKIEKKKHPSFSTGQQVKIKNESGQIEDNWVFEEIRNNNIAMVTKKGLHGTRLKNVSLKEFEKWNSENVEISEKPQKEFVEKTKETPVTKEEKKLKEKVEEKSEKFSSEIKSKLDALGITEESLRGVKDFDKISGSEGKVLSVLEKISQVRLKTIEKDATSDHEKHVREGKGIFQKVGRSLFKTKKIQSRKYEHEKTPLNIGRHRVDIEGIIHLADVGPEISVRKDAQTGKTRLLNEYLGVQEGADQTKVEAFNETATKYANLPPKYEWHKYPKQKKDFEKVEAEYENSKNEVLDWSLSGEEVSKNREIYEKQAMRQINDAEFNIKISQTLNHNPEVELELQKLAETKGWRRDWESLKAQVSSGNIGLGIGLAGGRIGAKAAMASVFGAAAVPFTVVGLGVSFGYFRGKGRAEKNLRKEEELLRMGSENKTATSRKIEALLAKRASLSDPKKIEAINKKIGEIRKKGTDDSFVKSESLVSKIEDLEKKVSLRYEDYLKDPKGKTLSLEEFDAKKEEWTEMLEVRVEFAKEKLDKGEISFGKEEHSVSNKFNLIKKMGEAIAVIDMNPRINERDIVNQFGHTRRSRLQKVLITTEMRINKNKNQYVRDQAAISALTGGVMSGAGYQIGHFVSETFGSHVAQAVHEEAQTLKDSGKILAAQHLERVTEEGVKTSLAHDHAEALIGQHDVVTPKVEVPSEKPFDFELKNETQSREYALIKYYEGKGLNHHDAGTKANLAMREIYGHKGEHATSFVHKGDHIVITEENGKPHIKVVSGKHIHASATEHSKEAVPVKEVPPTPAVEHPVAQHLEKSPEKFGFKGNTKNPEEVKAWSRKAVVDLINKNPHLKDISPDHVKAVYPTVTGGMHVETHAESIPVLMAHYEVKTPTSLSAVSENLLSKDPRWANLNNEEQNRVLYSLFVKQFMGQGHDAEFYKGLGIRSGNPFDIKPGTLKLESLGGKASIDKAFSSAHDSSLGIAKGFRNKIGSLIQKTKGYDPEDLFEENIVAILKQK